MEEPGKRKAELRGDYIFISYARKDRAYARQLADEFARRDFEAWIDDRIDYGDRWWRTIVQAIYGCAALVVIMSPHSEKSEWVEREIMLASRDDMPIFPILLDGHGLPLLITRQFTDVTDGQMPPDHFYELIGQAVKKRADSGPQFYEPELILIPGGQFLMGSDINVNPEARYDERPQHRLDLPDYYLARTTVTHAEYAAFVRATGHRPPDHWKNGHPPKDEQEHPVVNVTWPDAVAYCRWLARTTGKPYRLPTEAEWEKAARGPQGRIYPWGDQWEPGRCNSREGGPGRTTPVGSYPEGASPYGLLDMAGNVWEWCATRWAKPYPYDVTEDEWLDGYLEGSKVRVLRGGSWLDSQSFVRCCVRGRDHPEARYSEIGFRLASDARPVS